MGYVVIEVLNMKIILAIFLISHMTVSAQNIKLPSPKIGWDSLQSSINFPEINRLAKYSSAFLAKIEIDTTGKLNDIRVFSFSEWIEINNVKYECKLNPNDSLFVRKIIECCSNLEWNPGRIDEKKETMILEIPFIFYVYPFEIPKSERIIIIKEAFRPLVKKDSYK
jgi:hypothetical protein